MSCGGATRHVNPTAIAATGQWQWETVHDTPSGCIHTWRCRNALGVVGGPLVKDCTGCGASRSQQWVPLKTPPALTASRDPQDIPYLVGEAEWVDAPTERGAA